MLYDRLPKQTSSHWFCHRVDQLVQECAKFLIRMYAYDGVRAGEWKTRLFATLTNCADCVVCFQEAKVHTRDT